MFRPASPLPSSIADEATEWRRHLHAHPELLFDLKITVDWVTARLTEMGVDALYHDFAQGSVVAVIEGRSTSGPTLAIRADMDALPINEATNLPYRSRVPGRMHACGHDGHTAILMAAAKYLSARREFEGRCILVFQPAEEGGAGAMRMIEGGLFTTDRFSIDEIYGLHNMPGLPIGTVAFREGPLMAASDRFDITVEGRGGHAAQPQHCIDPIVVGAELVQGIQAIVARNSDPISPVVVSVTSFEAPSAYNVVPSRAILRGSVRTLDDVTRNMVEQRLADLCCGAGVSSGAAVTVDYRRGYDATVNGPQGYARLKRLCSSALAPEDVDATVMPFMAAEDFSYYLQHKPGAFLFLGNGDTAGLHSDEYDFNDAAITCGAGLWITLMEHSAE